MKSFGASRSNRFKLGVDDVKLYADRTRALPMVDPHDRELVMSCGAALFHLRLAIGYFGHADDVYLFPDTLDRDLLAPRLAAVRDEHFGEDGEAYAVSFEYFNPDAQEVLVAGSFNGWQPSATPMSKLRGGKWWTELLLTPGRYEYRLVVDGQWLDDPMATGFVANPFGGLNCVVEVKATAVNKGILP